MTDPLNFADNSTPMNAATMNKTIDLQYVNMFRNSIFESFLNGTSNQPPDCWTFDAQGATYGRTSAQYEKGHYSFYATKAVGDAGTSALYQKVHPGLCCGFLKDQWFTAQARVYQGQGSKVRVYFDDGVSKTYGDYSATANQWIYLSHSFQVDALAPTKLEVGVEIEKPASGSYTHYIDRMIVVRGQAIPAEHIQNPLDYVIATVGFEIDGAFQLHTGALRFIPWETTFDSGAGGAAVDHTYNYDTTSPDNRPAYTRWVVGHCVAATGPDVRDVTVSFGNPTANGFTIRCRAHSGTFTASTNVTVRGMAFCWGWNDNDYLFGNW